MSCIFGPSFAPGAMHTHTHKTHANTHTHTHTHTLCMSVCAQGGKGKGWGGWEGGCGGGGLPGTRALEGGLSRKLGNVARVPLHLVCVCDRI